MTTEAFNNQDYVNYAYGEKNAWTEVESKILDYCFGRFFKDYFGFLEHNKHSNAPKVLTKFGFYIPSNFSVLDLGTGTGRVAQRLIEFGIPPQNILGVDNNINLLRNEHFPEGVVKLHSDIIDMPIKKPELSKRLAPFNLVTANMVFHLLNYEDYVKCLTDVRQLMAEQRALLIMTVPHPLRGGMTNIEDYHKHSPIKENTPWGDTLDYQVKSIQDYERGLYYAGFNPFYLRSTGVGMNVDSNLLLSDEASWLTLQRRSKGITEHSLAEHFRLWIVAQS